MTRNRGTSDVVARATAGRRAFGGATRGAKASLAFGAVILAAALLLLLAASPSDSDLSSHRDAQLVPPGHAQPAPKPDDGAPAMAVARRLGNQQSRCADCHFANFDAPARRHLEEWDVSAHGRNRVGCESCHGGDSTTFDPLSAHAEIIPGTDARSPAHRANLPRTCGACHAGPYVAFQRSRHLELLQAGDQRVPTCSTCHGSVAAHLLSPRALEAQCASCHGVGQVAERPEASAQARDLLESITAVRATLREAGSLIRRVTDDERRASLEYDRRQAEVPLIEAADAGHAFEFGALQERLATARRRAEALMGRLLGQ